MYPPQRVAFTLRADCTKTPVVASKRYMRGPLLRTFVGDTKKGALEQACDSFFSALVLFCHAEWIFLTRRRTGHSPGEIAVWRNERPNKSDTVSQER